MYAILMGDKVKDVELDNGHPYYDLADARQQMIQMVKGFLKGDEQFGITRKIDKEFHDRVIVSGSDNTITTYQIMELKEIA